MAELSLIGLNHRTAPVEVRERLALSGDAVARLLRTFKSEPALEEAVVLSTCNRTELYSVPRRGHDPMDYFLAHLARLKGEAATVDRSVFYRHDGTAATRHLFRVAAALDSQIVGEHQILGQVKTAYQRGRRGPDHRVPPQPADALVVPRGQARADRDATGPRVRRRGHGRGGTGPAHLLDARGPHGPPGGRGQHRRVRRQGPRPGRGLAAGGGQPHPVPRPATGVRPAAQAGRPGR